MNATRDLLKLKAELALTNGRGTINESEVTEWLGDEFPAINPLLEKIPNPHNIYSVMKSFADLTKQLIRKENLEEVKHCFSIAEQLLQGGNAHVKNAIENCYLFSVATLLDIGSPVHQTVKEFLSGALKKEYQRQLGASSL